MYKYLFGPIPSRRLGMSLGIDLVPKKVCSLNCVYCEVGSTTKLSNERKEYIPYSALLKELEHYFANNPDPDYFTFSGSGEPLLNSRIGDVISFLKKKKPDSKVAVLTNGTLLTQESCRSELLSADLVLPSLDAASEEVFQKINRPEHSLKMEDIIDGLYEFRKIYKGLIWLEVFILPDYNYTDDELISLGNAIKKIQPDSVQLNTLDRPGTEPGLVPASENQLKRIISLWNFDNVEIIASAHKKHKKEAFRSDIENTILGTISRRPCTIQDISDILGVPQEEIKTVLSSLIKSDKITVQKQDRGIFYLKR